MSESQEQPRTFEMPMQVADQLALLIGRGAINQHMAEYHAAMSGSEVTKLKADVQDANSEIERLSAHNRTLESQLRALSDGFVDTAKVEK